MEPGTHNYRRVPIITTPFGCGYNLLFDGAAFCFQCGTPQMCRIGNRRYVLESCDLTTTKGIGDAIADTVLPKNRSILQLIPEFTCACFSVIRVLAYDDHGDYE